MNSTLKYKANMIPTCSDQLKGCKLDVVLWKTELTRGSLEMFPRSNQNRTIDEEFVLCWIGPSSSEI